MTIKEDEVVLNVTINVDASIVMHENGEESCFPIDDINGVKKNGEHAIICFDDGYYSEETEVDESYEEVQNAIAKAHQKRFEACKKYKIEEEE